jgi:hypothetical protein
MSVDQGDVTVETPQRAAIEVPQRQPALAGEPAESENPI